MKETSKLNIKIVSVFPKYSALWNYGFQLNKYLSKNKTNNVEFVDLGNEKKYSSKIYRTLCLLKGIKIEKSDVLIIVAPLLAKTLKLSEAKLKICIAHDFYSLKNTKMNYLMEKLILKNIYSNIKYADLILPVSDFCKSEILEFYGLKNKLVKLNGGINHAEFRYEKTKAKQKSKKPTFIHVGRDDVRKNFRFVLELVKLFDAKLIKVGSISKQDLTFIKENSLDVEIKTKLTEKELAKVYSSADMLLFPSTYEGLGLPPIEAMACGCPVLAGNNTGLKEVCLKESLLELNLNLWQKEINKLLKDEIYKQNIVEKGLIKAKQFDWEKYCNKVTKLIEKKLKQ